jgi:transcription antitermination factor NusG
MATEQLGLYPANLFDVSEADLTIGDERRWWAVYTRSRQEKVFSRQLAARQVPHYLPLIEHKYVTRGREHTAQVPLFPGYVFLYCSKQERYYGGAAGRISRIINVTDGGQLRAELVQIYRLIQSGAPLAVEQPLTPGNSVRVRSGPMEGLFGTVTEQRGETRLLISVTMLGLAASVEVEESLLERI